MLLSNYFKIFLYQFLTLNCIHTLNTNNEKQGFYDINNLDDVIVLNNTNINKISMIINMAS